LPRQKSITLLIKKQQILFWPLLKKLQVKSYLQYQSKKAKITPQASLKTQNHIDIPALKLKYGEKVVTYSLASS